MKLEKPHLFQNPRLALNEFITSYGVNRRSSTEYIFIINIIMSIFNGKLAGKNPWNSTTLEWQAETTPPGHGNFGKELPICYRWAYEYSPPGVKTDFVPQNLAPDKIK